MAQVPPRNPKYTQADLWPPGSKENVDFPPAAFHPVYLGNFLCQQQQEMVPRVQQYFASKGLLARMVFVRSPENDPFRNYQDKTKLYDCLVYFTRQVDAEDAVKYLHRDKYYGHRLNIFPGRTPERMNLNQSVVYTLPTFLMSKATRCIEDHILTVTGSAIKSSRRLCEKKLVVEYNSPSAQEKALRLYRFMFARPLTVHLAQQQDFLEDNVIGTIREQIQKKAFMAMCPEKHVLEALFAGTKPNVPMDWVADALGDAPIFRKPDEDLLFLIAEMTLKNFGIICSFVCNKASKSKQRVAKFKRRAERIAAKNRDKYRRAIQESCFVNQVKLPWHKAFASNN